MEKVPNILSGSRIVLAIILLIIYSPDFSLRYNFSIAIIVIASLTDFFDGKIARKYQVTSQKGYILDGLGDRAMHIALFMIFFKDDRLPLILLWFLIFREVTIYAFRILINDWHSLKKQRKISLAYVFLLRGWIIINLAIDGYTLYFKKEIVTTEVALSLNVLLISACCIAYYGLYKYFAMAFNMGSK